MASDTLTLTPTLPTNHPLWDSKNSESLPAIPNKKSLREAVAEITSLYARSSHDTVTLAIEIAQLKDRLLAGEAGREAGAKWSIWIVKETKISRSYVYFLAAIGSADDPAKALEKAHSEWNKDNGKKNAPSDVLSNNHRMMIHLVEKLNNEQAKNEYLQLWTKYRYLVD
jgi:hypothetical protein